MSGGTFRIFITSWREQEKEIGNLDVKGLQNGDDFRGILKNVDSVYFKIMACAEGKNDFLSFFLSSRLIFIIKLQNFI